MKNITAAADTFNNNNNNNSNNNNKEKTMSSGVEVNGSTGQLLDGRVASAEIRAQLKAEIAEIRKENPAFVPGLAIVQARKPTLR